MITCDENLYSTSRSIDYFFKKPQQEGSETETRNSTLSGMQWTVSCRPLPPEIG